MATGVAKDGQLCNPLRLDFLRGTTKRPTRTLPHMHTLRTSLALLALASCAAFAAPRTWTSADGRTIDAEYLGRGADGSSLVLARVDTKARVTIPLSALSAEDQAHAATLGATPAPVEAAKPVAKSGLSDKGKAMIRDLPAPWDLQGYDSTEKMWEVKQLREKIARELGAIPSGNAADNIARARVLIDRELQAITETSSARISETARKLWIKGKVLPLLAKLEAEVGK